MTKITTCNFRCKNCQHRFYVKVHGSYSNCPKKGNQTRDCPKCESRNVKRIEKSDAFLWIVIPGILGIVIGFLYLVIHLIDFRM